MKKQIIINPPTLNSFLSLCFYIVGIVSFAIVVVLAMNAGRDLPFGSTDDGPIYFLPLIKTHTDAWLSGHFLAIDWRLGSGWTPWEGIQAGAFYPPYVLANLLAKMIGNPLAILEVSACLHLALTGLLVYALTIGRLDRPRRFLWACLAMVQPAPIAIGMNWHNYLVSYPWFIGLLLLLWRVARGYSVWTFTNRLILAFMFAFFFLTAHPQMFVIGTALLFGWRLALGYDHNCIRDYLVMSMSLLPLAVPTIFIYYQSLLATPNWFAGRGDNMFLLRQAQSLPTWLVGLSVGNLIPTRLFSIWSGVSWTGIGIYFCPLLILSVGVAIRKRNWAWIALIAWLGILLSARSFPWVAWFSLGPFAGFRWPWKLSIFASALALAMMLSESDIWRPKRRLHVWALIGLISLSAAVSLRTLPFDLFPAGTRAPGSGISATYAETVALIHEWGIHTGARIAWVGKLPIDMFTIAAPLHGLMGNAPLLVGLQSAHLFEPLENHLAAKAHDGYSTPWRVTLRSEDYIARRDFYNERFMELGVTWLVSAFPNTFPPGLRKTYRDSNGNIVYGMQLPQVQEGLSFPWGITANGERIELIVEPGGTLRTRVPLSVPPAVPVGRSLTWQKLTSGHWRGTVELVDKSWFVASAVALALTALLLSRKQRWEESWI